MSLSELEKLEAGLPYDFMDPEVDARKLGSVQGCQKLNAISVLVRLKNGRRLSVSSLALWEKIPMFCQSLIVTMARVSMWVMTS